MALSLPNTVWVSPREYVHLHTTNTNYVGCLRLQRHHACVLTHVRIAYVQAVCAGRACGLSARAVRVEFAGVSVCASMRVLKVLLRQVQYMPIAAVVNVYVCVCVYIHIYLSIYLSIYLYISIYLSISLYICIYTYTITYCICACNTNRQSHHKLIGHKSNKATKKADMDKSSNTIIMTPWQLIACVRKRNSSARLNTLQRWTC